MGEGSGWLEVRAEQTVDSHVPAPALAELGAAEDAVAVEAGLLQGALLGEVVDVGAGLDAIQLGGGEEVLGEEPLGGGADASATRGHDQLDADVPRGAGE